MHKGLILTVENKEEIRREMCKFQEQIDRFANERKRGVKKKKRGKSILFSECFSAVRETIALLWRNLSVGVVDLDGKRRTRRRGRESLTGRSRSKEVNCPEIFNPVEKPRDPLLARRVNNGKDKFPIGSMANRVKRFSRLVILCFHPLNGRRRFPRP